LPLFGKTQRMPVIIGPDGFLCVENDPRAAHHAFLNDNLRAQAGDPRNDHAIALAAVQGLKKTLSPAELVVLATAAFARARWVDEHGAEIADAPAWTRRLVNVLYHLYALKLPFSAAEMCRLILTRDGTGPSVPRIAEYFERHELTPELMAALRQRRDAIKAGIGRGYAHVDVQNALQLLDMLIWHDEEDTLEPARCWSERVRRDFRAMSGERRERWRALLRHIRGDAGAKPPKAWTKEAQSRLAAVGAEDFRAMMTHWFAGFRAREPVQLSVVGSHVLKGLLWYAALARDPAVTEAALPLIDAPWKQKRNLDKVMVALARVIDTMPVDEAWAVLLKLQGAWGASEGQIERLVIKIAESLGIAEAQLRAEGVLKPKQPAPPSRPAPSAEEVAKWRALLMLSAPQSAEQFLATLKTLSAR
jgi:hypothetical protein